MNDSFITKWIIDQEKMFPAYASGLRKVAEEFLTAMFGPRCDDFEEGCPCCERWKLLDELLENPFEDK